MKAKCILIYFLLAAVLPRALAQNWIGPVYPPPLGVNFTGNGVSGGLGAGGITWTETNVPLAGFATVYWGATNNGVQLSLNGDSPTGNEIMTFSPALSSLSNGLVVWTGSTVVEGRYYSGSLYTRCTMQVNQPLVAATELGLSTNIGGLVYVAATNTGWVAQIAMEVSEDGVNYTPAITFYNSAGVGVGGGCFSSFAAGYFYATNQLPVFSAITNIIMEPGTTYGPVPFTVSDATYPLASLVLASNSDNAQVLPDSAMNITGSNGFYNLTVTTTAGIVGGAHVTLSAIEPNGDVGSVVFTVYSGTSPTPPTISYIGNQQDNVNTTLGPIGFTVGEASISPTNLTLSAQSSNPTLVPVGNITFGGSGSNRTVTIQPAASQTGVAQISLIVSDGFLTATNAFLLSVAIPPPTISPITNIIMVPGTQYGPVPFTVGDAFYNVSSLVLTSTSDDPLILPEDAIMITGSNGTNELTLTTTFNLRGLAHVSLIVTDPGGQSATNVFTVYSDTAPTISTIGNQQIAINETLGPIGFTVGDGELEAGALTLSAQSSNPALAPLTNIVFGGSGSNRTLTIQPAAGQTGLAQISAIVSDGILTATNTFMLTVYAPSQLPMFSGLTNIIMVPGTQYGPVPFTLVDTQYPVASLILASNSDNPLILPNEAIQITGSNGSYNLLLTTAFDFRGIAHVTLTAADPDDEVVSNVFTVYSDTAPTISAIGNQQILENGTSGPIGFTIGDQELVAGSLTLSAQSSNTALVPVTNIVFGGGGSNRTVTIQPAANQIGLSQISVIVSDGILTATDTFSVTVMEMASYSLATNALVEGPSAGSDSVALTVTPPNAPWTNIANAIWLHLAPGFQSGAGSTNVQFSFDANAGPMRVGTLTIAGQTLSVTQQALTITPPRLTGAQWLGPGIFRFTFTNTPGATFNVLSSTNLLLPLNQWTVVGTATNISSDVYQFTSPPTTNNPVRFYIVQGP